MLIGSQQYHQAKEEREGWEMGSSFTQGKNNFSFIIMSILHLPKFCL